jgi:uncharacterized protein with GYD domain
VLSRTAPKFNKNGGGYLMAKYIYVGKYSNEGAAGLIGGTDNRAAAIKTVCESAGAKFLSFEITRGQYDFCFNFEAKSFDVAGAILLKVRATGSVADGFLLETLNINSIRKAAKKVSYKGPAAKS